MPHDDRARRLLMLSSAGRRLSDLVAVSESPARYEVLRHLLRVSEETMTEVLEEVIHAGLVKRAEDPFTYISGDEETGREIVDGMAPGRADRLRGQLRRASERVFE